MRTISSALFAQNVDRYQDAAQHEPITISKAGRPFTVLMSAHHFEVLTKRRVAITADCLDEATLDAIRSARTPPAATDD